MLECFRINFNNKQNKQRLNLEHEQMFYQSKWKDIKTYNINIQKEKHKIVGIIVCKSYLKKWKK